MAAPKASIKPQAPPLPGVLSLLCSACVAIGFAGFASLQLGHLGISLSLVVAALMWFSLRATLENTQQRHKVAETIAGGGIVVFLGLLLSAGLMPSLMALLIVAQLALNIRADRDNRIVSAILIGLVCLLAGAAEAKSGSYLGYMATYGLAAAFTLKSLYLKRLGEQGSPAHSASGQTAGIPVKHNAKLACGTLGLALLIYLFMPRLPAGNLGANAGGSDHFYENPSWEQEADSQPSDDTQPAGAPNGSEVADSTRPASAAPNAKSHASEDDGYRYNGFDDSFSIKNPDSHASRFSDGIVARVKSDIPLYLKARVFDQFDGERWSQSKQRLRKQRLKRGHYQAKISSFTQALSAQTMLVDYQVHIERPMRSNIPFAETLTELDFPATVVARDAFGQWFAPGALHAGTVYGAQAQLAIINNRLFSELTPKTQGVTAANAEAQTLLDEAVQQAQQQRFAELSHYLTLPSELDPRIAELARDNAPQSTTDMPQLNQAIALEHFLRNHYEYDFDSIFNSQNYTPLASFLFETRKGHCEYFASALTIMLRTLDIPARLVTGLLAHSQNPLTGYFEVRALDGHAWVEAYVDDTGWVLLEPTAYYPMPEKPVHNGGVTAEKIQQYIRELERAEQETSTNGAFSWAATLRRAWYATTLVVTVALATVKWLVLGFWWLWLALAVLAVVALRYWRQYGGQLRNRYLLYRLNKKPDLTIKQHLAWLHQALQNREQLPERGLTIERFMALIAASHLSSEQRQQAAALFNQHYYSRHPLPNEQANRLREILHKLLRQTLAEHR
ncbi:MAG TPA: transglutaminaseTgpA domain-containing protein [Marinagarivorans sp.]